MTLGAQLFWLMVTIVIDGVDGPIARLLVVRERVPRIDGYVLDLIIDYVTCVIVPAAFMYQFHVVPNDIFGLVLLGAVGFTSALWFSRVDMMADDNWFRGFPSAWNLAGPVLYLVDAPRTVAAIVTVGLCVASLTSVPFPHIVRATFLRVLTLPVALVWFTVITIGASQLPDRPAFLRPFLNAGWVYFVVLSVGQAVRIYRRGQSARHSEDRMECVPDADHSNALPPVLDR